MLGVEGHHPLAGGAGGGLDAHAVLQGLGHQAIGIGLPQVGFGDKGQLMQVFRPLDVLGGQALGLHLLAVVGHIVPHMLYLLDQTLVLPSLDLFPRRGLLDQTLVLPSLDLFPRRGLDLGLVVPFHWDHPFLDLIFRRRISPLTSLSLPPWGKVARRSRDG